MPPLVVPTRITSRLVLAISIAVTADPSKNGETGPQLWPLSTVRQTRRDAVHTVLTPLRRWGSIIIRAIGTCCFSAGVMSWGPATTQEGGPHSFSPVWRATRNSEVDAKMWF